MEILKSLYEWYAVKRIIPILYLACQKTTAVVTNNANIKKANIIKKNAKNITFLRYIKYLSINQLLNYSTTHNNTSMYLRRTS